MTAIILIIILAFIAFCAGDSSGIEAIGKIILYIGLFIGVGCIIVYVPWLILVVIAVAIIWAVASSKSNSSKNSTNNTVNDHYIDYNQQSEKIKTPFIDNSNLTDFQKQLQENTKTPKQVEDENWSKEKEQITLIATNDFSAIKRALLDKAKNGQYTDSNGQKCISLNYYCSYLLSCVDRQYSRNPTGRMGTSSYRSNEKVSYHIGKTKKYDLYLSVIKELSLDDNISINPFFTERDVPHNCENRIPMPYTFTNKYGIGVSSHQIKVYLECFIQY